MKTLVAETLDEFERRGWLPAYERSGKSAKPRQTPSLLTAEDWEIAHYAEARGLLYRDYGAWEIAKDLVEGFVAAGGGARRFALDLPCAFGPLAGVSSDVLTKNLGQLFDLCGVPQAAPGAGGKGVFRAREKVQVSDLPEPYGKWLQLQDNAPRWRQQVDLELVLTPLVTVDKATQDAYLSVKLSTSAIPLLIRIAAAIKDIFGLTVSPPVLGFATKPLPPSPTPQPPKLPKPKGGSRKWVF